MSNSYERIVRLCISAVLSAIGVILVLAFQPFPLLGPVNFLLYDMADIPVLIASMLYGPVYGLSSLLVVAFLQAFLTVNGNQLIGMVMHFVSSGLMVVLVALFHRKFQKWPYTVAGMALGILSVVAAMIPLNYLFIPILFKGVTASTVTGFLPYICLFNVLKPGINCAATGVLFTALLPFIRKNPRMLGLRKPAD